MGSNSDNSSKHYRATADGQYEKCFVMMLYMYSDMLVILCDIETTRLTKGAGSNMRRQGGSHLWRAHHNSEPCESRVNTAV